MRVAILGCGPTGLIAAHASISRGVTPTIFSKKRKSELYGSQYLHEPIPGIDHGEEEWVKYINIGTPEEYRRKTHGKYWDGIIAPTDFETEHPAWDIRRAYHVLWRKYADLVVDYSIPTRFMDTEVDFDQRHPVWSMVDDIDIHHFDLVISTVPRKIWAVPNEEFVYSTGWALGDAPERGVFVQDPIDDMTIICNGNGSASWNRLSHVFGYKTLEWPADVDGTIPWDASRLIKPLEYKQSAFFNPANHDSWLHVGRYGEWKKGVVVSDAWHKVNDELTRRGVDGH